MGAVGEISWQQKSIEIWLKEGDRKLRFLNRMANVHYKRNWTSVLINDYSWKT